MRGMDAGCCETASFFRKEADDVGSWGVGGGGGGGGGVAQLAAIPVGACAVHVCSSVTCLLFAFAVRVCVTSATVALRLASCSFLSAASLARRSACSDSISAAFSFSAVRRCCLGTRGRGHKT